ncbi:MAG: GNAT family N-acetyltransferase [Anaerolineae bacterium]|nr:GNAT family N-acetyltransferase [Anaerolineae bacterium]
MSRSGGDTRGPAYRICTRRLVIRCWEPADAPLLKEAIDASLDHLRPWMPWARGEPQSVEAKVDLLRRFRGAFDLDRDYVYGVLSRDERLVLGGTGLHTRLGSGALEIGYWIRADHANQGLGTEVAAALTRVAFQVNGVERVEIHCDVANAWSAAIPRKLGYVHEATRRSHASGGHDVVVGTMIWTLFAHELLGSPAALAAVEAYDAMGQPIAIPAVEDRT